MRHSEHLPHALNDPPDPRRWGGRPIEPGSAPADDPSVQHEDELALCRTDIELGGYTVAAIIADESGCDWAYSIGLHHSFGHPELLVVGLDAPLAGAIVEVLAEQVCAGRRIVHGDQVVLDGGLQFRAHRVDDLWCGLGDWFNLGREVMAELGERWPATLQIVRADAEGRYPERSDDPAWFLRQPLLVGRT